jgi:hypothetical protein
MKRVFGSLVALSLATAGAVAQDTTAQSKGAQDSGGGVVIGKQEGIKLAKAECEATWAKANPGKKQKISAGQASPFIADIKAANTNGDGSIDQSEFLAACDKGIMKDPSSASTGSSSGTAGAGPANPAAP